MARILALLALLTAVAGQPPGVLKITVTIVDADGREHPVPRHALLISDNPVSAAPQRVVTSINGTIEVRLGAGNYTVESDEPLLFQGKAYEWAQTVNVEAGRDTILQLTPANAQIGTPVDITGGTSPVAGGASAILIDWQDSIVTIWSPTQRGSGFVVDARGLIATSQRIIGKATDAEVQLSRSKKIRARVVANDADRGVAILQVDPSAIAALRPMKLGYARDGKPPVTEKDKLFAIEAPLDDRTSLASGIVSTINPRTLVTNVNLDERSAGTPLLDAEGEVVAITTVATDDGRAIHDVAAAAVRIDEARGALAEAEKHMQPAGALAGPLPVEPERPFDDEALREAAKRRAGSLSAYQVPAEDFDVSVITPVMLYAARHREERSTGSERGRNAASPEEMLKAIRALQEFANWDDYVFDFPPVVMIRATPKLVEGFWTTLARGAAQSQGVSIPPVKRLKAGFARMRLFCGETEVTPIHPFRIEQRVSEREFVYEGLYVFDAASLGPDCKVVKLTLYSDKAPEKGDPRTIDAKIVQQVWDDFAPYRAAGQTPK